MFFDVIDIIIPLTGGILFGLISIFIEKYIKNRKEGLEKQRELIENQISAIEKKVIKNTLSGLPESTRQNKWDLEITQYQDGSSIEIWPNNLSKIEQPEIEKQVEERVLPLKKRIEEIERRFPPESTIEKIASINEAVLATRLDSLTEAIEKIEIKLLTKWDVAVVVLEIVGGLGVIIAIIFGIINLLQS